jgi:hypothetical protein
MATKQSKKQAEKNINISISLCMHDTSFIKVVLGDIPLFVVHS